MKQNQRHGFGLWAVILSLSAPLRRSAAVALVLVLSLMIFVFVDRLVFGLLGVPGIMNPFILQTAAHTARRLKKPMPLS